MKAIEEYNYINELLDLYGNLLTDKQKEVLEKYYSYNLSLSEISEELNISRGAVSDLLNHAKSNLISYENALKLNEKIKNIEKLDIDEEIKEKIIKELK